ncbi:MAG: hypothetical protein PUP91_02210 [Rhizonema sp. PD37]|nr:hypothetical protein [Rhizonema sp. PD37]
MQQLTRRQFWLVVAVTMTMGITVPVLAQNSTQQNPPASTYHPGYWQPIARINPKQPVTVVLNNQTKSSLKYNFLDGRADSDLAVGATQQLKNVSLPVNIAIYDPSAEAATREVDGLRYETAIANNVLTVTVMPAQSTGYHVLNIARNGGIYKY